MTFDAVRWAYKNPFMKRHAFAALVALSVLSVAALPSLADEAKLNIAKIEKITIGRKTEMDGYDMGNAMGVNTWAAFVGSDTDSVVDGDFAMLENELQGVLKALRKAKINIVAIHNHMTMETPRIIFLHFWGVGQTAELAGGIKAALDTQKLQ